MTNKIVLTADCEFIDSELREHIVRFESTLTNMNKRTKEHTQRIRALEKEIKELKEVKK